MPHYDWVWGSPPPLLKRHSEVKHALLRNYLIQYFLTLVSLPQQDKIQMTIVDGFSGGGLYLNEANQEVPGSPIVILEAIRVTFHHIQANWFSAHRSHPVFGINEPVRFRHI